MPEEALVAEKRDTASFDVGARDVANGSVPWYFVKTKHGMQSLGDVIKDYNNWRAGLTVALVSVPLSISLGIASGTNPARGLATAVFGGLAAGFFGGSDYNIVGPAGALSGMLHQYSVRWSDEVLPWMCLASCAFIVVFRVLGLHKYADLIPNTVFEGFTLAVAVIIAFGQMNFAFGIAPSKKHEYFILNVMESFNALGDTTVSSLVVFLVQTPLLLFLVTKFAKIPWTIIMPIVSLALAWLCDSSLLQTDVDILTLKSKYGSLQSSLIHSLSPFQVVVPTQDTLYFILNSGGVAFVAVLETLISAKIAGTRVDRPFDDDAEVRGLAIAHLMCGVTGAMPPTGVFVRTAMNTSLGATHRFSQLLNAVVVAIITTTLMPVFLYLPQATVAAILTVAAIRMAPVAYISTLAKTDKMGLLIAFFTAFICVVLDPAFGLLIGTFLHFIIARCTSA